MRFTTVTAVAAVAVLTACNASNSLPSGASGTVCRPHAQQSFSSLPQNSTPAARVETAARLGLWPRQGPSVRVCGDVGAGFARCQAWLRTDIQGLVAPNTPGGYAPSDLQTAYGLTSDSQNNGGGQTVAIVDAYDDPSVESDLNVYRSKYGLPACTVSNRCFTKQKYTSQTNPSWAAEESVDVEMVSAICPNCKILLVEAASTSTADLSSAEQYATSQADYVSDSWSTNEGTQTYDDVYTGCGTIVAATGDHGYNATAQWPAILPSVVGVGGTSLTSISPRAETAWLHAGSGCSKIYGKPSFQSGLNTGCSMRAQADASADADPSTGVAIYDTFQRRGWLVFGGTSVATPIVASVFALAGNAIANPVRNLYSHTSSLNDITSGGNGACGAPLCIAGHGWDGPTGLGTPNGIGGF
ncbi:MAG: S8 family serine peptidase [Candidatus Cybelea sp.]